MFHFMRLVELGLEVAKCCLEFFATSEACIRQGYPS